MFWIELYAEEGGFFFARALELQHGLELRREHALVHTNIAGAEPTIRRWVMTL